MTDAAAMNRELSDVYGRGWTALQQELAGGAALSRPFLVSVPDGYTTCKLRLMIVGQETYGWSDGHDDSAWSVTDGMKLYTDYDMNHGRRPSPFWSAAYELQRALNPEAPERAFVWTNLGRVDMSRGRPTQTIEERVSSLGWFAAELRITKPDVVVFFTGPSYDARLRSSLPECEIADFRRGLARVTGAGLPAHSYRTYHPRYLRMKKMWWHLRLIADLVEGRDYSAPSLPSSYPTAAQPR